MKKRLVTSALPYVNNEPHLGNLIQVLSADVFARYCRLAGYETFYACGTDEYGTATETRAIKEGVSPRELCDRYHALHRDIYEWFHCQFDNFGRTSAPAHTKIVQDLFDKVDRAGYINAKEIEQLYCERCERFLADRFVEGTCPKCGYDDARGDQCEHCGSLLEPIELVNPKCSLCGEEPKPRKTKHLYIDLPAIAPLLVKWMEEASVKGFWSGNAIAMTKSWLRDGLKERCITRDLKWGIPVPRKGYENKVFYVWFDAPIGYVSITAEKTGDDWKSWWQNPANVELFQFIGKDNIPFHTVVFPSSQLGSGENWTMLHHMSSTEYLNYETGKFSKSRSVGVFGSGCRETGIPADAWRFYLFYVRPEKSDSRFAWGDFKERINSDLIGNFANFVNRTLSFVWRFYDGKVPAFEKNETLWREALALEEKTRDLFEKCELKDALRAALALSDLGNKTFQDGAPWSARVESPVEAQNLIANLVYLARDIAMLLSPFIPETAGRVLAFLNAPLDWKTLGDPTGIDAINQPDLLFKKLEEEQIEALRVQYAGEQAAPALNKKESKSVMESGPDSAIEKTFADMIDLRVARVAGVKRHPDADKLYIIQLDVAGEARQIVSSIVPWYKEEDLLGKNLVIVANLKKTKFRGELSQGMLIAAETGEYNGADEVVEVLFTEEPSGTRVLPAGEPDKPAKTNISTDTFHSFEMCSSRGAVLYKEAPLMAGSTPLVARLVTDGRIG